MFVETPMNSFAHRIFSVVATTAAAAVVVLAQSEAAQAFLITRTVGPSVPSDVNPSLAAPTVIDFDNLNGQVPLAPRAIGSGSTGDGINGGATIERTQRTAASFGNNNNDGLRIGGNNNDGRVTFRFDDPRGMGYLGFFFENINTPLSNIAVSFLLGDSAIETFTGTDLFSITNGSGNYFNVFVTDNSEIFNGVVFADLSGNRDDSRYTIDNLAYQAIPTPALLPGVLALGANIVRKRKAETEAKADA